MISHLPPEQAEAARAGGGAVDVGAVLDPSATQGLPPVIAEAVRAGLADQLTDAFLLGVPILAVVLLVTAFIKHVPLRETVHDRESAEKEYLDTVAASRTDRSSGD